MVKEGTFREDLFYRLNVVRINLPPLRERGTDILVLAEHFLRQLAPLASAPKRLSPNTAEALLAHLWPGNVRELRNVMQQAVVTVRTPVISRADLALNTTEPVTDTIEALLALPYAEAIARVEKLLLERALHRAGGNRAEAARQLGIRRQLLYAKLREHGLGWGRVELDGVLRPRRMDQNSTGSAGHGEPAWKVRFSYPPEHHVKRAVPERHVSHATAVRSKRTVRLPDNLRPAIGRK